MFERFTDRARKVMALANQEATRLNHDFIDTEHILLGLVKEGSGNGANTLKNLDLDLRKIRLEVEKKISAGSTPTLPGKLPQNPKAKSVIVHAIEESRNFGHNYVGTEHILLGLLLETEGIAGIVLAGLGLTIEAVREEVLNFLKEQDADSSDQTKLGQIHPPLLQGSIVGNSEEVIAWIKQTEEDAKLLVRKPYFTVVAIN
ncbi:MAG: hypothetical protein RJA61_46 [Candidatus Parcubacteria bacterium]|jgi:ATP-dependent Clp protease ATP-binding subunit ClpC